MNRVMVEPEEFVQHIAGKKVLRSDHFPAEPVDISIIEYENHAVQLAIVFRSQYGTTVTHEYWVVKKKGGNTNSSRNGRAAQGTIVHIPQRSDARLSGPELSGVQQASGDNQVQGFSLS